MANTTKKESYYDPEWILKHADALQKERITKTGLFAARNCIHYASEALRCDDASAKAKLSNESRLWLAKALAADAQSAQVELAKMEQEKQVKSSRFEKAAALLDG